MRETYNRTRRPGQRLRSREIGDVVRETFAGEKVTDPAAYARGSWPGSGVNLSYELAALRVRLRGLQRARSAATTSDVMRS